MIVHVCLAGAASSMLNSEDRAAARRFAHTFVAALDHARADDLAGTVHRDRDHHVAAAFAQIGRDLSRRDVRTGFVSEKETVTRPLTLRS